MNQARRFCNAPQPPCSRGLRPSPSARPRWDEQAQSLGVHKPQLPPSLSYPGQLTQPSRGPGDGDGDTEPTVTPLPSGRVRPRRPQPPPRREAARKNKWKQPEPRNEHPTPKPRAPTTLPNVLGLAQGSWGSCSWAKRGFVMSKTHLKL